MKNLILKHVNIKALKYNLRAIFVMGLYLAPPIFTLAGGILYTICHKYGLGLVLSVVLMIIGAVGCVGLCPFITYCNGGEDPNPHLKKIFR